MKKTKKIQYWVGIIASLLLFLQSVSGIYLYFQQQQGLKNMQNNRQAFFQQQQPNTQNQQGSDSTSSDSVTGQNGAPSFNGQGRQFNRGQMNLNREGINGTNSFSSTLRKLQNNIINLFIMLIVSIAALILSIMASRSNRNKTEEVL